ncbi:MAG TPA: response regulator [Chryseosolibacter sp.]|nr:response regulator [Chryseosolibacter sp.]
MSKLVDKAMLIDDSEIDLFIHRRFLELCNFSHELISYRSAESALEWLKNLNGDPAPDLIFLDLNMPVVDGFSFLNHFNELPRKIRDRSRIVVLTSSSSTTDREQVFLYENVVKMITKPIKQADIDALRVLLAE